MVVFIPGFKLRKSLTGLFGDALLAVDHRKVAPCEWMAVTELFCFEKRR